MACGNMFPVCLARWVRQKLHMAASPSPCYFALGVGTCSNPSICWASQATSWYGSLVPTKPAENLTRSSMTLHQLVGFIEMQATIVLIATASRHCRGPRSMAPPVLLHEDGD